MLLLHQKVVCFELKIECLYDEKSWFVSLSRPVLAVQVAVADGFGQVGGLDGLAAFQVGNGAGYLEDTVVGAGREVEACHGAFQQGEAALIGTGVEGEQTAGHLCIAVDSGYLGVALLLHLSGTDHAFADDGARFAGAYISHLFERDGGYFNLQVDAVEQGAGDAVQVLLYLSGAAHAWLRGGVVVAAGAGIHAGYEHEAGGIFHVALHARDTDLAVFQRLAEYFEHVAAEFGQLVQKENTVVGEADFARLGKAAASGHGDNNN